MAGRTSTSVGVGVTVTILGVATLALFITSVIFFANKRAAERALQDQRQTTQDYVSDQDRGSDAINRARDAGKTQRMTAIAYLVDQQQKIMQRATGARTDTLQDLAKKLEAVEGGAGQNMLAIIRERDSRINGLEQQVADANAAAARANADRENEARRVRALEEAQNQTVAALNAQLDQYKDEVDRFRGEVNQAKQDMEERVQRFQTDAAGNEQTLRAEIDKLQREKILNQSLITRLQDELKGKRVGGQDEYALVDGQIIGHDAGERTVVINRGRRDKVVLGMTFGVFSEATEIRADPVTGNYPDGKATIEVIRMDDRTSTCRILRERRGNPVVRGDVVANAVYDPEKTYKFMIYGNFDADGDGRATFEEQTDIRARIEAWGGKVLSELTGDVDFLILGERPVLPPEPSGNAPLEVINQFISLKRQALRYDELFSQAQSTSIPIHNQNRLYTLTGAR